MFSRASPHPSYSLGRKTMDLSHTLTQNRFLSCSHGRETMESTQCRPLKTGRFLVYLMRPLGYVSVFWTHTVQNRKTGWLNSSFHQSFRELLCHMLARYSSICPVYCLMLDHIHLLISGIDTSSNQLRLTKLIRKELNKLVSSS